MLDLENLTEPQLEKLRARYEELAHDARKRVKRGERDTDQPEIARAGL